MLRHLCIRIRSDQKIQPAFSGIVGIGIINVDTLHVGLNDPFPTRIGLQHVVPCASQLLNLLEKGFRVFRRMILPDSGGKLGFAFLNKPSLILAHLIPFRVVSVQITLHGPLFLFSVRLDLRPKPYNIRIFLPLFRRLLCGTDIFVNHFLIPKPVGDNFNHAVFQQILRNRQFQAAFAALDEFTPPAFIVIILVSGAASSVVNNHLRAAFAAKKLAAQDIFLLFWFRSASVEPFCSG